MITIVDYGIGNLGSVQNMLKKIGVESIISGNHRDIQEAEKIIFPGVGAFATAMDRLRESNLIDLLSQKALKDKVPLLGICLGMQLMTRSSEEGGKHQGLGWINGETVKFSFDNRDLKVPHKGWNIVHVKKGTPLFQQTDEELKFYFDHSFYVQLENREQQVLSTPYGIDFTSSFQNDNLYGVQFHPEKSHRYGMALLKNFANI